MSGAVTASLCLEDGTVYEGKVFGFARNCSGEIGKIRLLFALLKN